MQGAGDRSLIQTLAIEGQGLDAGVERGDHGVRDVHGRIGQHHRFTVQQQAALLRLVDLADRGVEFLIDAIQRLLLGGFDFLLAQLALALPSVGLDLQSGGLLLEGVLSQRALLGVERLGFVVEARALGVQLGVDLLDDGLQTRVDGLADQRAGDSALDREDADATDRRPMGHGRSGRGRRRSRLGRGGGRDGEGDDARSGRGQELGHDYWNLVEVENRKVSVRS